MQHHPPVCTSFTAPALVCCPRLQSDFGGHNKVSYNNINVYPQVYGPRCVFLADMPLPGGEFNEGGCSTHTRARVATVYSTCGQLKACHGSHLWPCLQVTATTRAFSRLATQCMPTLPVAMQIR